MNLKKYRQFINLTQLEMAKIANIGSTAYWYKEKGYKPFNQDEMLKIYKYIKNEIPNITFEDLFYSNGKQNEN